MNSNNYQAHQKGQYELVLVLIVSILLSFTLVTVQSVSLLKTRESVSSISMQKAFYGAEGALRETYSHLINDRTWPGIAVGETYTDQYSLASTTIDRLVTKDSDEQTTVDVTATYRDYKRRLRGTIEIGGEEVSQNADIIVLLDNSSSLVEEGPEPFEVAKDAADYFISTFNNEPTVRFALITFNRHPELRQNLTFNHQSIRDILQSDTAITVDSGTNTAGGLALSNAILESDARPGVSKIVVLFSDGYPTRAQASGVNAALFSLEQVCASNCETCVDEDLLPDGVGNCCSNSAMLETNKLKTNSTTIFSILIFNPEIDENDCRRTLADHTLLRASSEEPTQPIPPDDVNYTYFKHTSTDTLDQLNSLYDQITETISTIISSLTYREEIPTP